MSAAINPADVLDLADILLLSTDGSRRIVEVSGPWERIVGVDAARLIGREPSEYLHPGDIDWRDEVREQLARTGRASGRVRVRRQGVDYVWMDARLQVQSDGGVLLLLRPIEAQLDAELAVRIDPYVVLEAVPDEHGTVVDLHCIAANDGAAAAFGATPAALVGVKVSDMLPRRDADNVIRWCLQALDGGEVALDDERWPSPDGGVDRYIDVRAIASGDRVTMTWRDITERHAVAAALAESEAAYRLMADFATDVIVRSGIASGIEWISPSVTEVLGWTPEELIGRRVSDLMHPDDLHDAQARQRAFMEAGLDEGRITARFATADGGWRWMSDHGRLVRDASGTPVAGIDALRDVDDEQVALVALQRRERELRGIVDSLLDPWILLEAVRDGSGQVVDFTYLDANEAACAFNHVTREELIGLRLLDLLPEHGTGGIFARYADVVETGVPLADDDMPFTSPFDGLERRFDNRAVKVGDGISLMWRDVTERYRTRQLLREQADHDQLTGVANRRLLERRMGEVLERQPRQGAQVAVLYCDLDRFKEVNDTYGHSVGDEVLIAVADGIRGVVREADVVARLGGDEFVVLLTGVRDASDAESVAAKIRAAVRRPVTAGGVVIEPRLSIGIAVGSSGEDPTELLARADGALYRAKAAGRDRAVLADSD